MADISQEIDDFKNAIYGEEVRDSMVSLAEKLNTEVEENTTNVNQAVSTANSASSAANQAVQDANTTLQAANQAVQNAAGSASAAAESATAASGSASAAAQSAANAADVAEGLGGFTGAASSVTAQDVEGLLGSPGAQSNVQALIDAIANQVLNQLVKKSQIINNLLATQPGNVLDAVQGKALSDMIGDTSQLPEGAENVVGAVAQLNSDLQTLDSEALKQVYVTVNNNTVDDYRFGTHILYGGNLLQGLGESGALEYQYEAGGLHYGAQLAINYSAGIRFRTLSESKWSAWKTIS